MILSNELFDRFSLQVIWDFFSTQNRLHNIHRGLPTTNIIEPKMFSQLRMREEQALLAHDYALEQAEEQGLKKGLVNLVRQHLLIAEIASQQLSMTVAEFEELL